MLASKRDAVSIWRDAWPPCLHGVRACFLVNSNINRSSIEIGLTRLKIDKQMQMEHEIHVADVLAKVKRVHMATATPLEHSENAS